MALLLVPVAWVARERQRMLEAREAALRAVVLAERNRALAVKAQYHGAIRAQTGSALSPAAESSSPSEDEPSEEIAREAEKAPDARPAVVEQLRRENAELKKTVEELHREIERLKAGKG
jgi:predicted RNase H-like nuclease (RuvC/YqgF family)